MFIMKRKVFLILKKKNFHMGTVRVPVPTTLMKTETLMVEIIIKNKKY